MEHRSRHLYHARIQRHMTLEQIGLRTALSPSVLRHIDEGRYDLLPSGVYARSYVRMFANAVGLDPAAALAEVEHLLPGVPDPVASMNQMNGPGAAERLAACQARFIASVQARMKAVTWAAPWPTRWGAAAIDALLLLTVDAFLVMLISWSSGLPPRVLLNDAGWALGVFCAIPITLYFLLFKGIAGGTAGCWLCRLIDPPPDHPLRLLEILRRGVFQ